MTDYVGRFAPSPTGPLHIGSLIAALASYLDARANGGCWLLRIEDLDPPREMPGAADRILHSLEAHGLQWDGPVLWQSQRHAAYREAVATLLANGEAFYCTCSRADLTPYGGIYPGTCRGLRTEPAAAHAIRFQVPDRDLGFADAIQGELTQSLRHDVGDFVLRRKDSLFAYQLAVVVDDGYQGITHVVRGADLLDSTPRQIALQRVLKLPTPVYAHLPVITNAGGQKLSKQTFARELDSGRALANLVAALRFLNQPVPAEVDTVPALLAWAVAHWELQRVPRRQAIIQS